MSVAKDVLEDGVRRVVETGEPHYVWKDEKGRFTVSRGQPPAGVDFWRVSRCGDCMEIHYEVHVWNLVKQTWEALS